MKETEDRHEHMHTERSDIDHLSFSERLVEQQVLVYLSDTTGYIYTIIISYKYNLLTYGLRVHIEFSVFRDHVVKKECRQFLLNCSHASWC